MRLITASLLTAVFVLTACEDKTNSLSSASTTGQEPISQSEQLSLFKSDYEYLIDSFNEFELKHVLNSESTLQDLVLDYHSSLDLALKARAQGIDKEPKIAMELKSAERKILIREYMQRKMDAADVPEDLSPLARERYSAISSKLFTEETRDVAHILIPLQTRCGCSNLTAEERAEQILSQLNTDADFGELAKQHSWDFGTARNGGILPRSISRNGDTEKPFEDAVFALQEVGDISQAVVSNFGIHIIKLLKINQPRTLSYDEVANELMQSAKESIVQSVAEQERSKAYPRPGKIQYEKLKEIMQKRLDAIIDTDKLQDK